MTHKAKIPEPTGFIKPSSADFIKSLSDHGRLYTEIKRCGDDEFTSPIYTTTQAQAYADARAREVLISLLRDMSGHVRAAHSRFGETGKPYDEGRRIAYEQAAADIRALIPPLSGPVEP